MRIILAVLALLIPLALTAPEAVALGQKAEGSSAQPKGSRPPRTGARKAPRNPAMSRSALERWRRMSPDQRRKALQKLPPERRRALQDRMNRLEGLSPDQRRKLRQDYQRFQRMPPDQQRSYRQLYGRLNRLPADRRPLLMNEYRQLRRMSPQERKERLESDQFRKRFRAGEQRLLEDLSTAAPREK